MCTLVLVLVAIGVLFGAAEVGVTGAARVAPASTLTEAFAWLETAVAVGGAIGAAVAGALVQAAGPPTVFAFAGAMGLAALLAAARLRTRDPGISAVSAMDAPCHGQPAT